MTTIDVLPQEGDSQDQQTGGALDDFILQESGRQLLDSSLDDFELSPSINSPELEQVAGPGGWLSRLAGKNTRKIKAPKTDLLLKQGEEATQKPPEVDPELESTLDQLVSEEVGESTPLEMGEDGRMVPMERGETPFDSPVDMPGGEEYAAKLAADQAAERARRTWERNVNLDYVESEQDIGRVLDANAKLMEVEARRPHAEVEASVDADAVEILRPILQGKQNGLLTDKQLLAGRRMLVTMMEKVDALADKLGTTEFTKEEVLQFEKLIAQSAMLQRYMQGQVRETARALASMRISATALNMKNTQEMLAAVEAGGTEAAAVVKAQILRDAKKAAEEGGKNKTLKQIEAMGEIYGKQTIQALATYWTSSILSGFKTNTTNLVSNGFVQMLETLILKPMAAGVGSIRRGITGDTTGVSFDEAYFDMLGAYHSFWDATLMAGRVFKSGAKTGEYTSSFNKRRMDEVFKDSPTLRNVMPDAVGKTPVGTAVDWYQRLVEAGSFGLLTTGDEFYKSIAYRKSLYSIAARDGFEAGHRGKNLTDYMNKRLNNIDEELHKSALAESERQTFTNDLSAREGNYGPDNLMAEFGLGLKKLVIKYPGLKFIVPFIDTPVNLFNYALRIGPLAPITKDYMARVRGGGADADVAIAELTFGVSMMGMLIMAHQSGSITGGGPKDYKQRKALEGTGWKPYSVKVGDKWFSYNRGTDPLGMMFSSVTGIMDKMAYERDEPAVNQLFTGAVFSMAAYAKDASYLQGIGQVFKMIESEGVGFEGYMARQLSGFIPGFVKSIGELVEDKYVDPETGVESYVKRRTYPNAGFWDSLSKQVDARIDRENLKPLRYWDGEVVTPGNGVMLHIWNTTMPIQISPLRDDKASYLLQRSGISPTEPKPVVNVEGVQIDLLQSTRGDDLYDKYVELVGKARKRSVDALINTTDFDVLREETEGPGTLTAIELTKALNKGTTAGKKEFVQYLFNDIGQDVDGYGEIAQLFSPTAIKTLRDNSVFGLLTQEDEDILEITKVKGVGTRDVLPVPGFD